ncbi:hypothetical protein GCM10028778_17900 [Barrientosiimonas marina]|uniref:S-layer homology domain-containing protein n=1 Tax=Lentibacillus kimchii TaxID=1542911 RepID=A0ABW2US29_9BACI
MNKKTFRNAAISTMAASATVAAVAPAVSAESFSDVSQDHEHFQNIMQLTEQGVIKGHDDGTFRPYNSITRGQVAAMLTNALDLDVPGNVSDVLNQYDDVDASSDYAEPIAAVTEAGIFIGNNGDFGEYDNITREQMATALVEGFDLNKYDKGESVDLNKNHISKDHEDNVQTLANLGITVALDNYDAYLDIRRDQFATMMKKTLDVVEEGVPGAAASVSAVNNTTVEVDFGEDVNNVADIDFAIDGLDINDAVVKQTDDSVVKLTTSAQEANKEYTVTGDGDKLGKFTGVSAVTPDNVEVTTKSLQGTIGEEVTLKAQVDVDEDESAAGIPVTFNITNDNDDNETIEVEANTNEEGVAEYSYTRYYDEGNSNDSVVAYATQKSDVFDTASVYWGESLSIDEVKDNDTLANGAKKAYEVTGMPGETINIAFEENTNVDPDELVRSVDVIDSEGNNKGYPSQVTTGGSEAVEIELDEDGEATFTLSGNNATVTPVVFADGANENEIDATERQAAGSAVTFELTHSLGINIDAQGEQRAAADTDKGMGGRDYQVTVTDEDGDRVPEGTDVGVVFEDGALSSDKDVNITDPADADNLVKAEEGTPQMYEADEDGQITFHLTGEKDGFAMPTIFLDNGNDDGELDSADLQRTAEKTYFVDADVANSELTATVNGENVDWTTADKTVTFGYQSQDQNGFDYYAEDGDAPVNFEVTAGANDLEVSGTFKDDQSPVTVKQGKTQTVTVKATDGFASIDVESADGTSETNAQVEASSHGLPDQEADIHFADSDEISGEYTGTVASYDTDNQTISLDDKNAISYENGSFTNMNGNSLDKDAFEKMLADNDNVELTVKPDGDDWTFEVASFDGDPDAGDKEASVSFDDSNVNADDNEITVTGSTKNVEQGEDLNLNLTGNDVDKDVSASVAENGSFEGAFTFDSAIEDGKYTATVSKGDATDSMDITVGEDMVSLDDLNATVQEDATGFGSSVQFTLDDLQGVFADATKESVVVVKTGDETSEINFNKDIGPNGIFIESNLNPSVEELNKGTVSLKK